MGFISSVLEASTEHSMIATDPDGVIRLWNEGARRLYGYAASEIIGRSWSVLHIEEDVGAGLTQEVVDQTAAGGEVGGRGMVGDRERIAASGFDGYIQKPIDPQTFIPAVERFLPSERGDHDRAERAA